MPIADMTGAAVAAIKSTNPRSNSQFKKQQMTQPMLSIRFGWIEARTRTSGEVRAAAAATPAAPPVAPGRPHAQVQARGAVLF